MNGSTISTSHKPAQATAFLRGFTNSPWTPVSSLANLSQIELFEARTGQLVCYLTRTTRLLPTALYRPVARLAIFCITDLWESQFPLSRKGGADQPLALIRSSASDFRQQWLGH
jgi:hypothetical protein